MNVFEGLILKDILHVAGRGNIFIFDKPKTKINIGDKIKYIEKIYEVRGIEKTVKLLDPPIEGNTIGLLLKEVKNG